MSTERPELPQGQSGSGGNMTNYNAPTPNDLNNQSNPNNPQGSSRVSPGWYVAGVAMLLIFLYFAFFNKKDDVKLETVKSTIEQSDAPTSTKENQNDSKGKSGSGQSNRENNSTSNTKLAENEVMYGGKVRVYEPKGIYDNGCDGGNFVVPNYQVLEKGSNYAGVFCAVKLDDSTATLAVDEKIASTVIMTLFGDKFKGDYLASHLLGRTLADDFSSHHEIRREDGYLCFDVRYSFAICPGYLDWCYLIVNPTKLKRLDQKYYPATFKGNSLLPQMEDHQRLGPCDMDAQKDKPQTVSSSLK